MFLKCRERHKDGKVHRTWSVVESRRYAGGKVAHRHVLYLGEVNDAQREAWQRTIEVVDERTGASQQLALFPSDRVLSPDRADALQVRLSQMRLCRPRQWGACWLGDCLWRQLGLDEFFGPRLGASREGTDWEKVLRLVVLYRLISPGSEWRLHRHWFDSTALGDLLGIDARSAQDDTLYRVHDRLLEHKEELFAHLRGRWAELFDADYEVLLYDLTSTYFECDVPGDPSDPRRFGYSRDRRSDCVQVIIALVVTPDGLPLAYEMLPGNTADKTTLRAMLARVQARHGRARRVWVMDRGIPTEEVLAEMRACDPPVHYLVGTPKARLNRMEEQLAGRPWAEVRGRLRVKSLTQDGETYIYTENPERVHKERSMRRRALKKYCKRLGELAALRRPQRDEVLIKLGQARQQAGKAAADLVHVEVAPDGCLTWRLDRPALRQTRRREGRYLLRTNLPGHDPATLWRYYIQLVGVEESFRNLKGDLGIRPVFHQRPDRIEAHLFTAFLAYCLHTTLRQHLRPVAGGLTPRSVLEKLATLQLLDVIIPTTDGRELLLTRHTEPSADVGLLLDQLHLTLPSQPPPKIRTPPTFS
ncbi:MAG: IS1634 family transposase [Bdellovibrionaceae bacterium]|nr:IS1634 family transposase [Pseudobdellovibrionaceae bacterium]